MLNYDLAAAFLLVFARTGAFLSAGPLFFFPLPRPWKAGAALVLSLVLFPVVPQPAPPLAGGLWGFGLLLAKEVAAGLALGFVAGLPLQALALAGQIMDIQMGFFMSGVFDPSMGHQVTINSRFLYLLGLVLFLILDGHHVLIAALARSFEVVPLGGVTFGGDAALAAIRMFAQVVSLGLQLAAPVVAVVLITDICLGLLGRTAPEMNVFMLGFPLKVGLGILVLGVMVPLLGVAFRALLEMVERDLQIIMRGLA
ncbi:flagellar biosynthetic protein FliR [Desulfovirgula thermocuniculi]|uniref:flagellar biosynthetic protein FliR n=1 Tax=Desulfovirgula thermocuniculi TaxID=348842 RepID=UPI0003F77811|nr:flagellar biosynthetic protein FliR [Desulfovirgula thermocuniculi]